jgi:DNA-binding NarL/FixJ family response regulator
MPASVVVVDDHDIIREGIKNILDGQLDYEIVGEAANGVDALESVARLKPDFLLLDITMPQKSGLDILEQVRRISPATKILIISVHKSDAYVLRALRAGVRGYLNKDSAADDLIHALKKISAGQVYLSAQVSCYLADRVTGKSGTQAQGTAVLTDREQDVLRLVAEGKTAKEIASTLFLSVRTVENYKNNLLKKLNLRKASDLIKYAIRHKIISIDDV